MRLQVAGPVVTEVETDFPQAYQACAEHLRSRCHLTPDELARLTDTWSDTFHCLWVEARRSLFGPDIVFLDSPVPSSGSSGGTSAGPDNRFPETSRGAER